jgi:hypothetical protein
LAQAADEPERVNGNPYYGPGWDGPVSHAPPPTCPAWYASPTTCVAATADEPEHAAPPAFSTLESAEDDPAFAPIEATPASGSGDAYYGPGWSGPVNATPPAICPAWYSTHTACVPATSGADER